MSEAIDNLQAAQKRAMAGRPKVGGFPYLAETLKRAGVTRNLWFLPACGSLYLTEYGSVVTQGAPLLSGTADVPPFDRDALIAALRTDQAGHSTFPEFLGPAGAPELSATRSISPSAASPTMAVWARSTQKTIQPSTLSNT